MTDKVGFRLKTLKKYRLDMEGVTGSIPVAPTNKSPKNKEKFWPLSKLTAWVARNWRGFWTVEPLPSDFDPIHGLDRRAFVAEATLILAFRVLLVVMAVGLLWKAVQ